MNGEIHPAFGDFRVGERVASYHIDQLIGRGGMAVVYRATDVRLDRMVALKILNPDLASNDSFRQRFIRESRAGAAVDHPHVIPVFEAGEADGVLFIAMRYVSGSDVRALIEREGRLSAQRTVDIVTQVASALDAAHAHGLVHRDVKPANMLLAGEGSASVPGGNAPGDGSATDYVYLSDFGLSKQSVSSPSLTRTGQFLGTLDYMSPEQISGKTVDGRTDLYALACAAFEMLTGQPPFKREANLAVMWAQISAEPPSIRQWRPDLSPAVDEVIGRALAKAPDDRQASCVEFALALRAACATGAGAGRIPEPTDLAFAAGAEPTVTNRAPGPGVPAAGQPVVGAAAYPVGLAETAPGPAAPGGSAGVGPVGYQYPAGPTAPGYGPGGTAYAPGGGASGPGGFGFEPQPPPRRNRALPILLGCLVVAAVAAAAVVVLHLKGSANPGAGPSTTPTLQATSSTPKTSASGTPSITPTTQGSQTPAFTSGPRAVVKAYYDAVNSQNYARAWQLNLSAHQLGDYSHFVQGFSTTQHVTVTSTNVSGDTVYVQFASLHTDGTTYYFSGSYTVQNGKIVGANISCVGTCPPKGA